ncbi:MAG TPA: glycosyltransferase [Dongiaceae bacterium]|nr:glycosyltransferase [Dongiaceae bacterium]
MSPPERSAGGAARWPYGPAVPGALPRTLPGGRPWPKISIVTPSLNQGCFIEETILSVLNQGYPAVEHIVVDGGSTDETPAVLARYRDRLAWAVSEPDRGQGHAINKGFERATGDILAWLNADDMLAPGALAALALGQAESGADLVAGICVLHEEGRPLRRHLTACADGPLPLEELLDLEGCWLAGEFFYQPEVFFSRGLWQKAGGRVDEQLHYSMDYELWLRFAEAGGVLHGIGVPLAWYRVHPEQKTFRPAPFQAELRQVRDAYLARSRRGLPAPRHAAVRERRLRVAMVNDVGELYGAGIAHGRIGAGIRAAGHEVMSTSLRAHRRNERLGGKPVAAQLADWLAESRPDLAILGNLHGADGDASLLSHLAGTCPTIAVLHDFWLLTGRCAYPGGCTKYASGCDAACPTPREYPALAPEKIALSWAAKRAALAAGDAPRLFAYSPSAAAFARSAFPAGRSDRLAPRVEEFRLGVPLEVFRPQDREACRRHLGLPLDRFIVLFGAASPSDRRKGAAHLFEALARLQDLPITCCIVGLWDPAVPLPGIDLRSLGYIKTPEELAAAYAAADLFVGPSLAETFGQVFAESAASGTPVIGFPVMGVKDAIRDGVTGRLAAGIGADHLERAIRELYANPGLRADMGVWGRLFAANEWSLEAGYRHFFLALERSGLRARLGIPRRINFVPGPGHARRPSRSDLWDRGEGMGEIEGPYPDRGLPTRFHWCTAPSSRASLKAEAEGRYLVLIEYQNPWLPGQEVTIFLDGRALASHRLRRTPRDSTRLICFRAPLTRGSHELRLAFSRSLPANGAETRRLALMLNDIHLERLPSSR